MDDILLDTAFQRIIERVKEKIYWDGHVMRALEQAYIKIKSEGLHKGVSDSLFLKK